jgi:hypothetical protein
MLAGELPFSAAAPTALMRMHEDSPPPLEKLGGLPGQVIDLVAKMMSKRPDDRHQHVSQLLAGIENARQTLTGARTDSWMADATAVIAPSREDMPEPTYGAGTVFPPDRAAETDATQLQQPTEDPTRVQRPDPDATEVARGTAETRVQQASHSHAGGVAADLTAQQTAVQHAPTGGHAPSSAGGGAPPAATFPAGRAGEGGGRNRLLLLLGGAAAVVAVAVVGVIIALSALGGGGGDDDDDDDVRRGGNGDRPTPRVMPSRTPRAVPVTDAEFDAAAADIAPSALVSLDDYGDGWTSGPGIIPDREFENISGPCRALVEENFPGQALALDSDEYTGPDSRSSRSDLAVFRTEFDAIDAIDAIDAASGEPCFEEFAPELERVFLAEVQAAGLDITDFDIVIEERSVDEIGDYSGGVRFTVTSTNPAGSSTFVSDVITMRVGRLIANVYLEGLAPDEELLASIAESLSGRMQEVDAALP